MDTNSDYIKYYKKGVITNRNFKACGTIVNHSVLAVGYGHDESSNLDFVLIKNSWGENWGEDGFARISLEDDDPKGTCGILKELV
jgi:C1A family cysteine protease